MGQSGESPDDRIDQEPSFRLAEEGAVGGPMEVIRSKRPLAWLRQPGKGR